MDFPLTVVMPSPILSLLRAVATSHLTKLPVILTQKPLRSASSENHARKRAHHPAGTLLDFVPDPKLHPWNRLAPVMPCNCLTLGQYRRIREP